MGETSIGGATLEEITAAKDRIDGQVILEVGLRVHHSKHGVGTIIATDNRTHVLFDLSKKTHAYAEKSMHKLEAVNHVTSAVHEAGSSVSHFALAAAHSARGQLGHVHKSTHAEPSQQSSAAELSQQSSAAVPVAASGERSQSSSAVVTLKASPSGIPPPPPKGMPQASMQEDSMQEDSMKEISSLLDEAIDEHMSTRSPQMKVDKD